MDVSGHYNPEIFLSCDYFFPMRIGHKCQLFQSKKPPIKQGGTFCPRSFHWVESYCNRFLTFFENPFKSEGKFVDEWGHYNPKIFLSCDYFFPMRIAPEGFCRNSIGISGEIGCFPS